MHPKHGGLENVVGNDVDGEDPEVPEPRHLQQSGALQWSNIQIKTL